jgi:hypothetical protein
MTDQLVPREGRDDGTATAAAAAAAANAGDGGELDNDGGEVNHGPRPPFPSEQTVVDLLWQHAHRTPTALALVLPEGERVDGLRREVTYGEMAACVRQAAAELLRARRGGGHRRSATRSGWVVLVLPEGLAQVVSVWAVLAAGLGYVPIDSETSAEKLRVLLAETEPCAVIGAHHHEDAGEGGSAAATVAAELAIPMGTYPAGVAEGLVVVAPAPEPPDNDGGDGGDGDGGGGEAASDAASVSASVPAPVAAAADVAAATPAPEHSALLLFSSGSTGVPKGIVYDHRWLMGGSWFVAQDMEVTAASRTLQRCSYVWSVSLYDLFPATMMGVSAATAHSQRSKKGGAMALMRGDCAGAGRWLLHSRRARCSSGRRGRARTSSGATSVASFLAAVLTEIYLCNACSCQEILRRNGRGQASADDRARGHPRHRHPADAAQPAAGRAQATQDRLPAPLPQARRRTLPLFCPELTEISLRFYTFAMIP